MFRTLHARVERWPLATPFRISRGIKTAADVVTVALRQGDALGRGESVPYARYGEDPESVIAQIQGVTGAVQAGASREDLLGLLPPGAARNAIDCSLWDLEASLAGAFPEPPAPVVTAVTISLDRPAEMAAAAARAMAGGARLLKAKLDAREPGDCLQAIRAAAPGVTLIADANEGWSLDDLRQLQPLLRALRITFVEQPLPAGEDAALEGLSFQVPLCADESCHTGADLDRLAGRYSVVNVKLDKTGGLTEAQRLVEAARARGFGVMLGCMVCTSLAIAPAFRIAALADFVDLDGPLWLRQDRDDGVVMRSDGLLAPPAPALWGGGRA
ncbi:N-acetyl-D-Glu racemase DgcA [Sphingomonas sp.]|uniref:N-acetyl-D-Glu racemase DgcA n=1 Tax=Sphingomonas sp. TaxID=28214 RepID=UPI001B1BB7AF|nr:N-acetyl-D-Glu racemase DgcA [Sphingomonas sp.]MBO9713318.1 dipeptide epimerase [Sphingomonas sp.]